MKMQISASIKSRFNQHEVMVGTNGSTKEILISPKSSGYGSSVNGGELLLLALGTCYCNDIYREAAKRGLEVSNVEVRVKGEFGADGEPGSNFTYEVDLVSNAAPQEIEDLIKHTDRIAEIHKTLRQGIEIKLNR